ncbi:transcription factor RcaD [Anabaena subtropica]|uniref:Transcription factor RcaD n=1 Tax=Anabaena subtropica FACHB-260 TaxID=2692884 RepID=A0ABR8CQ54_9NOST|nr:transcription factor RcaD [Anabaena subtropica]MBD2345331.1 transcription factor RcaD [Anabaena subtropica FACHB-260]
MDTNELKFLLKLLGFPNYRTGLSASAFSSFKGKDKICRDLSDRELVDYSREIATVKILPAGQAVLTLEVGQLPITDKELKVLEKISKASGKIAPSKITSLKAGERDTILKTLSERGLIEAEQQLKKAKGEVWLTERGIEYLRDDYNPNKSSNPVISQELLGNYVRFLRKTLAVKSETINTLPPVKVESSVETIDDEEILLIIEKLDRELGTENYLPIFHLRQKLQPPLSRDELDQALYRLQKSDQIELSSLQEVSAYTPEQIDAGIPQNIGGSLFFITVDN